MSVRERFPTTVTPVAIGSGGAIAAQQLAVGSIYLTGDATTSGANAAAAAASALLAASYVASVIAARDAAQGSQGAAATSATTSANSATASAGSATASANSATASAGSATAAATSASSASAAITTAIGTAATTAATAAASSTSASLIASTAANASAAAASAAAAAQSAADAAAIATFDASIFAQRGSANIFTAANTFDNTFRINQRGGTQASIDLLTKSTAAADLLGAAGTKGYSFIGKGDTNVTTADRNDLVLSYYNGTTWSDYWRVDSLTGAITMSARPVFGANTPWDSGNFTPSTKVDTSVYSADQATNTTALAGKVPTTRTVNGFPLSANVTLAKADVGLGNVDNTSDVNKPVSTAQAAADAGKMPLAGTGVGGTNVVFGDVTAARAGGANGVIFLNSGQPNPKYLWFNGSNYEMPGADLSVNGTLILAALAGKQAAGSYQAALGYVPARNYNNSWVNYVGYDGIGFVIQTDSTWWGYVATTAYVSSTYMPKTGGTFTGNVAFNNDNLTVNRSGATPLAVNRTTSVGIIAQWQYNSANIGSVSTPGGTTVLYNTSSDERIKPIRRDFDAGPILDNIEVVNHNWKDQPDKWSYGVIAQDVFEVFPDAVSPGEGDELWGVDYSKFVPLLLKEIQHLRGRLERAGL